MVNMFRGNALARNILTSIDSFVFSTELLVKESNEFVSKLICDRIVLAIDSVDFSLFSRMELQVLNLRSCFRLDLFLPSEFYSIAEYCSCPFFSLKDRRYIIFFEERGSMLSYVDNYVNAYYVKVRSVGSEHGACVVPKVNPVFTFPLRSVNFGDCQECLGEVAENLIVIGSDMNSYAHGDDRVAEWVNLIEYYCVYSTIQDTREIFDLVLRFIYPLWLPDLELSGYNLDDFTFYLTPYSYSVGDVFSSRAISLIRQSSSFFKVCMRLVKLFLISGNYISIDMLSVCKDSDLYLSCCYCIKRWHGSVSCIDNYVKFYNYKRVREKEGEFSCEGLSCHLAVVYLCLLYPNHFVVISGYMVLILAIVMIQILY